MSSDLLPSQEPEQSARLRMSPPRRRLFQASTGDPRLHRWTATPKNEEDHRCDQSDGEQNPSDVHGGTGDAAPSTAATSAMTRNVTAQENMFVSSCWFAARAAKMSLGGGLLSRRGRFIHLLRRRVGWFSAGGRSWLRNTRFLRRGCFIHLLGCRKRRLLLRFATGCLARNRRILRLLALHLSERWQTQAQNQHGKSDGSVQFAHGRLQCHIPVACCTGTTNSRAIRGPVKG